MAKPVKLYKSYAGSAQDYEFVMEYLRGHGGLPKDLEELSKTAVIKRNASVHRRGQDYVLAPGKHFYLVRKGTLDVRAARLRKALEAEQAAESGLPAAPASAPALESGQTVLRHGDADRAVIEDASCGLVVAVAYHEGRFDGKDLDVRVYNRDRVLLDAFEAGCTINPLLDGYKDYALESIVKAVNEFGHVDFGGNRFDLTLLGEDAASALIPTHKERVKGIRDVGKRESLSLIVDANESGSVALKKLIRETKAERDKLGREIIRKDELGYPLYPRGSHVRGELFAKISVLDERSKLAYQTLDQMGQLLAVGSSEKVHVSDFLKDIALASLSTSSASGMVFIDSISDLGEDWGRTEGDLRALRDEVEHYGLDSVVEVCLDPAAEGKDYVVAAWDIAGVEIRDLQAGAGDYGWAVDDVWAPRPDIESKRTQAATLGDGRSAQPVTHQQIHSD